MIKTRLLKLLKGSGKYIGANIFWQWIALLFQIAAVFAAGNMIQQLFEKTLDQQVMLQTAGLVILAICARFLCEKGACHDIKDKAVYSASGIRNADVCIFYDEQSAGAYFYSSADPF